MLPSQYEAVVPSLGLLRQALSHFRRWLSDFLVQGSARFGGAGSGSAPRQRLELCVNTRFQAETRANGLNASDIVRAAAQLPI